MIRWVAGLARRAGGTCLLLLFLLCGAEVVLRLAELRAAPSRINSRDAAPTTSLTVPSWSTYTELRPSTSLRWPAGGTADSHVVRINSFGIRGPEPQTPKPRDRHRILCLGDERLLAAHLSDDVHLAAQLEQRLQPATKLQVEVWNAGVPGGCPLTQYLLLTRRLTALQPDLVLCFIHPEHLVRDQAYRRLTRLDTQGRPLACRHPSLGRTRKSSVLSAWRQEFRLVDTCLLRAGCAWKEKTTLDAESLAGTREAEILRLQQDQPVMERTLEPLAFLSDWCRDSYAGFALVEISDARLQNPSESPWDEAVRRFAEEQSLCLIQLSSTDEPDRAGGDAGWTPDDHQLFAEAIALRVLSDIRGPWNSPYFQSEQSTITPTGHATESAPGKMIQHDETIHRRN